MYAKTRDAPTLVIHADRFKHEGVYNVVLFAVVALLVSSEAVISCEIPSDEVILRKGAACKII